MIEFKMIDYFLFGVAPHLFVVVFVFIENPFEVGHSFSKLDLFPNFSIIHDGPHKILIVVAVNNCKG
jgi:hypothetical protein